MKTQLFFQKLRMILRVYKTWQKTKKNGLQHVTASDLLKKQGSWNQLTCNCPAEQPKIVGNGAGTIKRRDIHQISEQPLDLVLVQSFSESNISPFEPWKKTIPLYYLVDRFPMHLA